MSYSDDELNRIREYVKLREKASQSLKDYGEMVRELAKTKANVNHFTKESQKYADGIKKTTTDIKNLESEILRLKKSKNADRSTIKDKEKQLALLKDQGDQLERNQRRAARELKDAKDLQRAISENLNKTNALWAAYGSLKGAVGSVVDLAKQHSTHLLEQQKGVKMSEFNMGILAKRSEGYRKNLYSAALSSNKLGISAANMAEMQSDYADEVGRTVLLSESGQEAMAELAAGTVLGAKKSAIFAANMENFGYSVKSTNKFMEETLNTTGEMGLSANEVTNNLADGLDIAKNYKFSEGIKGLTKMVQLATKYKLELKSIQGVADKAFEPEGAIELAAQLSVLGGQWSNMGDPFALMFKSRTDLKGLAEDVAKAASGTAQWNEATGEFEIASMELHRLQKVSEATGLSMDELTDSARNFAKFSKIKSQIVGNFDDNVMEFIASTSQMTKNGEATISIKGDKYFVNELHRFTNEQLSSIAKEQATLKERALKAQKFDEAFENLINQLKATILPGFDKFADVVLNGITKFGDWMQKENVLKNIQEFGTKVGEFASTIAEWVIENPLITGLGIVIGKTTEWVLRGQLLGLGFNMSARAGGVGAGATTGGVGSRLMGGGRNMVRPEIRNGRILSGRGTWVPVNSGAGRAVMQSNRYAGYRRYTRNMGRLKGFGIGAGIGLAGGALDMYNQSRENPYDSTGKTINLGAKALEFAGAGAAIGSLIAPGAGTVIGGAIGGLGGLAYGHYQNQKVHQDFVARPGEKPISFSSADTLIGMKKGGGIDNFLTKNEKKGSSGGAVEVDFKKPFRVEGQITLTTPNGGSAGINLDDPILVRELSRMVQEQLTIALNGKKNTSPVT
jgi:hypothetical protein